MEFEGSEAGIVKNLRKMKVLGGVAGRRRESFQGGETARPGSNIVENVRFGRPGPFPGPWRPMPPLGQSFWTLLAWSWGPKMRAGNLLARPTGPNPTVRLRAGALLGAEAHGTLAAADAGEREATSCGAAGGSSPQGGSADQGWP